MSDSNDVLEHGDWRHAADVINMITKLFFVLACLAVASCGVEAAGNL